VRIAIVTRNANPWVYKLIWELADSDNNLLIANQSRPPGRPPWRSWRFIRRRGLFCFLDLWLQSLVARAASAKSAKAVAEDSPANLQDFDLGNPPAYAETLRYFKSQIEKGERSPEWWDTNSVNSREFIKRLKEWQADLVLLCGAPIIRKRFFRQFPLVINPHCGIVPEYKGSSPMHWAVYRREFDKIGFTIHLATPDVDGGPILTQQRAELRQGWNLTAVDWYLVYSMYTQLAQVIREGNLLKLAETAKPQQYSGHTWPPMGLIRTRRAERRLQAYLKSR